MTVTTSQPTTTSDRPNAMARLRLAAVILFLAGVAAFFIRFASDPARAWQGLFINFLVFSAMAQGAVLFAPLLDMVKARWGGPLAGFSACFAAFFPVSLVLFIVLLAGAEHIFPWRHHDLHGKEVWLNLPFLFGRDLAGLVVLYSLGIVVVARRLSGRAPSAMLSGFYILTFALVLSLLGYDLVMAADPHWYSTLFGAYSFVKAVYLGLAGLIIAAALLHLTPGGRVVVTEGQFHDIGKLLFAFCLVWADFFYCQFIVIWYGNIPEETAYIITRTMARPWNTLAWTVFVVGFVAPFLILINRKVKTMPRFVTALCLAMIAALWLEHYLLLGPAFHPQATSWGIGVWEVLMGLGFAGLMALCVGWCLNRFPLLVTAQQHAAKVVVAHDQAPSAIAG